MLMPQAAHLIVISYLERRQLLQFRASMISPVLPPQLLLTIAPSGACRLAYVDPAEVED